MDHWVVRLWLRAWCVGSGCDPGGQTPTRQASEANKEPRKIKHGDFVHLQWQHLGTALAVEVHVACRLGNVGG